MALAVIISALAAAVPALGHEGVHGDPELLNDWRTQVHLLLQWGHLVAFGLWVGGMLAATWLPRVPLEKLLLASWALFLVSLGTGSYNMEFSAATPEPPDVLSLPGLWDRYEFGAAYIILIGAKQGLLGVAAAITLTVSIIHLRWPPERPRARLRQVFVGTSLFVGLTVAAVTSIVLVLHEAVDLAPTPLHSLGGVVGPRDHDELAAATEARRTAPPPYGTDTRAVDAGFRLFAISRVTTDALARFGHLIGFALWLGASAATLLAPAEDAARALPLLWIAVAMLAATGIYQLASWTPFSVVPYPWRIAEMQQFRFGFTYTAVLGVKLGLALLALTGTVVMTLAARRRAAGRAASTWIRASAWANVLIGLALAYAAMTLLLVHEGVDHAL